MKKLMIGLAAVFAVACTSQVEEVSHLDAQLAQDGVYGTYTRGDVRLEFASFELEPGAFAVTIIGDGVAIDTMILPPAEPVPEPVDRPTLVVDYGPQPGPSSDDFGTFLLPPGRAPLVYQNRPTQVVDYGPQPGPSSDDFGTFLLPPGRAPLFHQDRPTQVVDYGPQPGPSSDDLGTFLLPPDTVVPAYQTRPTLVVDFGPEIDDDLADFGAKLIDRYPDQPMAVTVLLRVLGAD